MKRSLLMIITASLLAGCGSSGDGPTGQGSRPPAGTFPAHRSTTWDEPSSYSFQVRSRCGEQNFIGTFRIAVADGEVTRARGLDPSADAALRYMKGEVPTLADLLTYAAEAQESDAEVVEVDYDPNEGYPKKIVIDYNKDAIDDESCFVVTHFRA